MLGSGTMVRDRVVDDKHIFRNSMFSPKFAGLFIAAALVLLVHPVVVAVLRGGTVFVWAQAVRMVKRDTQLLVRTAKPVL